MKDLIIETFKELNYNNVSLYDMLQIDHGPTSPYHKEGSILTHLEMVYDKAVELYPNDIDLHLACILHDVGKPFCRFYDAEKDKIRFNGHESFSVFVAIDVLQKLKIKCDIIRILKLIQRHADPYKYSEKNIKKLYTKSEFEDVLKIHKCDTLGRTPIKEVPEYNYELVESFETLRPKEKFITLMVGPQNAGKSTFLKHFNNVVSMDEVIEMLCPDKTYNQAFNEVDHDLVSLIYNILVKKYYKDFTYLSIDKMHLTIKSRNRTISKFKENVYYTTTMICGLKTLLERNSKRKGKVLDEKVIFEALKMFQFVYSGEKFIDEIYLDNFKI
jgi:polynucleotide adenylyltransferase/metal dependent phosphohydrolase